MTQYVFFYGGKDNSLDLSHPFEVELDLQMVAGRLNPLPIA